MTATHTEPDWSKLSGMRKKIASVVPLEVAPHAQKLVSRLAFSLLLRGLEADDVRSESVEHGEGFIRWIISAPCAETDRMYLCATRVNIVRNT